MVNDNDTLLAERLQKARELRAQGYNCSQTVVLVFASDCGISHDEAARISAGLGGGIGGCGEACGVVSAMAIVVGALSSGAPKEKAAVYSETRALVNEFAAKNCGFLRCSDLKGKCDNRSCEQLIADGIEILHSYIEGRK